MLTSIGQKTYTYRFHHEPTWEPEGGVLLVPKQNGHEARRHVRGRTLCTVAEIDRNTTCPRHGLFAKMTRTDAPVQCICTKSVVRTGIAFCSCKDHFDEHAGRRHAFRKAIEGFSKDERGVFWKSFLVTHPQMVVVPRHLERRRVMSE